MKTLNRYARYFFFLLLGLHLTVAVADTWYAGFGAGTNTIDHQGRFQQQDSNTLLSIPTNGSSMKMMGNLIGGYEWIITPQFFLSTQLVGEMSNSQVDNHFGIVTNGNNISITTQQKYNGGYGFVLQPGLYSTRLKSQIFMDIGMIESKFETTYDENNGNTHFNNTHWGTGFRIGMGGESALPFLPGIYTRLDGNLTRYPSWTIHHSAPEFFSKEKPLNSQIMMDFIWKIDAGDHLVSDAVLHHGLAHYMLHPNDFGNESKNLTQSPY